MGLWYQNYLLLIANKNKFPPNYVEVIQYANGPIFVDTDGVTKIEDLKGDRFGEVFPGSYLDMDGSVDILEFPQPGIGDGDYYIKYTGSFTAKSLSTSLFSIGHGYAGGKRLDFGLDNNGPFSVQLDDNVSAPIFAFGDTFSHAPTDLLEITCQRIGSGSNNTSFVVNNLTQGFVQSRTATNTTNFLSTQSSTIGGMVRNDTSGYVRFTESECRSFEVGTDASNIIVRYNFEEDSGSIVYDNSGFNVDGDLVGDIENIRQTSLDIKSDKNNFGYTDNAGVHIPADQSDLTKDVLGNELQHVGQVKYNVETSNSVLVGNGSDNYIDTGIAPTSNTRVEISWKPDNIASNEQYMIGYDNSGGRFRIGQYLNNVVVRWGTSASITVEPTDIDKIYNIAVDKTGMYLDGVKFHDNSGYTFTPSGQNLHMMSDISSGGGTSRYAQGTILSCKIYENDVLVFSTHVIETSGGQIYNEVDGQPRQIVGDLTNVWQKSKQQSAYALQNGFDLYSDGLRVPVGASVVAGYTFVKTQAGLTKGFSDCGSLRYQPKANDLLLINNQFDYGLWYGEDLNTDITKADGGGSVSELSGDEHNFNLKITTVGTGNSNPVTSLTGNAMVLGTTYKLTFNYKVNSGVPVLYRYYKGADFVVINESFSGEGEYSIEYTAQSNGFYLFWLGWDGRTLWDIDITNVKIVDVSTIHEPQPITYDDDDVVPNYEDKGLWFNDVFTLDPVQQKWLVYGVPQTGDDLQEALDFIGEPIPSLDFSDENNSMYL